MEEKITIRVTKPDSCVYDRSYTSAEIKKIDEGIEWAQRKLKQIRDGKA